MEELIYSAWYHRNPGDQIWWRDVLNAKGYWLFSFDKKTEFNLFHDYPWKLTSEQKEIFDRENPYWKNFFRNRQ